MGQSSMANYIRGAHRHAMVNVMPREGFALERANVRQLLPATTRRLWRLVESGGELPSNGESGVLLPPLSSSFLADELGCRASQAQAVLDILTQDGLLIVEGGRYRVPDPGCLRQKGGYN